MFVRVSDIESFSDFGNESFHSLPEFIQENSDSEEVMAIIPDLLTGKQVTVGGGAGALYFLSLSNGE